MSDATRVCENLAEQCRGLGATDEHLAELRRRCEDRAGEGGDPDHEYAQQLLFLRAALRLAREAVTDGA